METLADIVMEMTQKEKNVTDVLGWTKEGEDSYISFIGPLTTVYEEFADFEVQVYDPYKRTVILSGVIDEFEA